MPLFVICPHVGCIVQFNDEEKTWDCPCHGSGFFTDGEVLEGPALGAIKSITGKVGKVKIVNPLMSFDNCENSRKHGQLVMNVERIVPFGSLFDGTLRHFHKGGGYITKTSENKYFNKHSERQCISAQIMTLFLFPKPQGLLLVIFS